MKPVEQEDLVILFNHGDAGAFGSIYNQLSPGLFSYTKHFIERREDAEDIITETFFKLWSLRGEFENWQKIISFLHIAAKNASLDRLKHLKLEYNKKAEVLEAMMKNYEITDTPDDVTMHLLNRIQGEMEKLPKKSRSVLKMFYFDELKNPKIAELMGTNEKTVRNQKVSALNRLRSTVLNSFADRYKSGEATSLPPTNLKKPHFNM